ncbi:acyltransferase family protein, partial [Klebsiella pneumoniae]
FLNFYLRRCLRIVPLFYVLLILFTYLLPNLAPELIAPELARQWHRDAPWYFAFLGNLLALQTPDFPLDPLAVSWSLAVEEQFYLVWPFA